MQHASLSAVSSILYVNVTPEFACVIRVIWWPPRELMKLDASQAAYAVAVSAAARVSVLVTVAYATSVMVLVMENVWVVISVMVVEASTGSETVVSVIVLVVVSVAVDGSAVEVTVERTVTIYMQHSRLDTSPFPLYRQLGR